HQAHQIDLDDLAEAGHLELAAAIDHGALREHKDVELVERRLEGFDCTGIADVELRIGKTGEIGAFLRRIFRCVSTRAANRNVCSSRAKGVCDAVADSAGTADDQYLLAREIQLVRHRGLPFCFGCLTCLRIDASLVNHNNNKTPRGNIMSEFKQLSR